MKAVIFVLALVAIGAFGWVYLSDEAVAPEASTSEQSVEESAAEGVDAIRDGAAALQEQVESATEGVRDSVGQAVESAVERANEAVSETTEGIGDATRNAEDAASEALGLDDPDSAVPPEGLPVEVALTPERFDAATLLAAIEASDLTASEKETAMELVDRAESDPDSAEAALDELRTLLAP